MKIAIPVDKKTWSRMYVHPFGRTPYFLIYDVETKESVFIDNSAAGKYRGCRDYSCTNNSG